MTPERESQLRAEADRERHLTSDERKVTSVVDVQAWIDEIRDVQEYAHIAHPAEDALHRAVLRAISNGTAIDGSSMAALALTTWTHFQFSRWYD